MTVSKPSKPPTNEQAVSLRREHSELNGYCYKCGPNNIFYPCIIVRMCDEYERLQQRIGYLLDQVIYAKTS